MRRAQVIAILLAGCFLRTTGGPASDAETSTTTEASATTSFTATVSSSSSTDGGSADGGSATTSSSSDDGNTFIAPPPDGGGYVECDVWEQDCPRGEKCMPWANDGGNAWNATKCVPIVPDPNQPGEPCTVQGSPTSGIDDCDTNAMCWAVDPETLMGTCAAFCNGDPVAPGCDDPCETCPIVSDGVLILCMQTCDPLAQGCPPGQGCYAGPSVEFICAPDWSGPDFGDAGTSCEYINGCDPGLVCVDAWRVPDCEGALGCCTLFCDLTAADPCPGAAPGVECVPWFPSGRAPVGDCDGVPFDLNDVGACMLP
jgi:hypothetical protein